MDEIDEKVVKATGVAARPAPGEPVNDTEVRVPEGLMRDLDTRPGDIVRVRSYLGRSAYTRVQGGVQADGSGDTLVRIGRLLWTQLLTKPGDQLELEAIDTPPVATEVRLRPPFHLSHNLGHRVADELRRAGTVVWSDAKLFSTVFPGGGGVVVRVVGAEPDPGLVGPDTEIHFEEPDPDVARRRITFAEVGGLDDAIERMRDLIELPLLRPGFFRSLGVRAPKGVLLHGPPGTGKTLLSRAVAEELGANVMKMPATDLVGTFSGETEANLRSLFSEASHHAPTLIIIDEIDVIASDRARLASQSDIRATTQLLTLMDGLEEVDGVVVLATSNRVDVVDEAFRRPGRFDEEIYVGPPEPDARREILTIHTREMPLTVEGEAAFDELAEHGTSGFTGADLMHLVREAGLVAARRLTVGGAGFEIADATGAKTVAVDAADVHAAMRAVSPSAMRGLPAVDVHLSWGELDGLEEVKQELHAAALRALEPQEGSRREGILLAGDSGNGKSVLVHALADELDANLIVIDGSTIFTQWLGESEAALRSLFGKARDVTPSIVLLEHLDAIAPRRSVDQVESASSRVLSALLSSMDTALGRGGCLVVGVTDRPDIIDPALVRSGRLGVHLEVGYPDDDRRRRIVRRRRPELSEEEVERLVRATESRSAADVDRRAERADA